MTESWVEGAGESDFPLDALPFATVRVGATTALVVAIGDRVLNVSAAIEDGLVAATITTLDGLLAAGPPTWRDLRHALTELLGVGAPAETRDRVERHLYGIEEVEPVLPFTVADYVDFYSSIEHATNLGRLMRPGQEPLLPNWRHLPVGYHGRSSTIVVSGTPVRRPNGQTKAPDADAPSFGPCRMLDFELEVGFVTGGPPTRLGERIAIEEAEDHIFGVVLVNDWSARDIQAWEYQPLGPFLAKSFATSISPWVVPLAALEPFRVPAPAQDPEPLPYLREGGGRRGIDLDLSVRLNGSVITTTNFREMYWTMAQQLAHTTVNGSIVRPGDLYVSGTVSGRERGSEGSLIELTHRGAEPIRLDDGSSRAFLEDGDSVVISGRCSNGDITVGFGSVEGTIKPAVTSAP